MNIHERSFRPVRLIIGGVRKLLRERESEFDVITASTPFEIWAGGNRLGGQTSTGTFDGTARAAVPSDELCERGRGEGVHDGLLSTTWISHEEVWLVIDKNDIWVIF